MNRFSAIGGFVVAALSIVVAAQTPPLPPAPKGFDVRQEAIPHGTVGGFVYRSKTTGGTRPAVVYTPPGYSSDQKYPVLYLLHGVGDDETGWQQKGSAGVILDNLYSRKKLVPMIVVMPNGFARRPGSTGPARPAAGGRRGPGLDNSAFESDLLTDLIPFVESHYPAMADRDHRGLAGLSMGGGQALSIGLRHLDVFAFVGGFSAAANMTTVPANLAEAQAAHPLSVLWLSCGDKDRLMQRNSAIHDKLDDLKIPHLWHIDSGAHEWPVWKNDLYLLSQRLFQ